MQLGHLIVGEIDHAVATLAEQSKDLFTLLQPAAQAHTDKDTGVVGIGKAVVELGHRAAAKQLAKLQEAALLFGNSHRQQRFTLFTQLAAFGNVAQTVEVDVRPGEHVRQPFTADIVLGDVLLHARQSQCAGRFCYRPHILEQILHGGADRVAVDGNDIVEILPAEAEGLVADAFNRHPFGK